MPADLSDIIPNASYEAIDLIKVILIMLVLLIVDLLWHTLIDQSIRNITFLSVSATFFMGSIKEANCRSMLAASFFPCNMHLKFVFKVLLSCMHRYLTFSFD